MVLHKEYNIRVAIGDIHEHWSVIYDHIKTVDLNRVCYIQVGDFGIGYNSIKREFDRLNILNDILVAKDSHLLVIRGNHDNPSWFVEGNYSDVKEKLTNIYFVPDYTILDICGENILFIGGAVSIDRMVNKRDDIITGNKSHWDDECVNFDFDKIENIKGVDRMICHTSPDFCEPLKFGELVYLYAKNDSDLLKDLSQERSNMTKMLNIILSNNKLKTFHNGHFHQNYFLSMNGCDFITLGINSIVEF